MLLEVGRIDKAHGVRGEVLVTLHADREERVAAGATFSAGDQTYTVVTGRRHQHRWCVQFREISSRELADDARGTILFAEPLDDPDTLWVHELIDAHVIDIDGRRVGRVQAVEENPASDMLVIESGALIPLVFLVERNAAGELIVELPDGLLELAEPDSVAEDGSDR